MSFSEKSEVIIIDNGSTDNSYEWIKKNYPSIKIVQNSKNLGVTAAWNQGLKFSSGKYLCIANNDLIFSKGCIEALKSTLENHKWVGLVSPYTFQDKNRNYILYLYNFFD